MILLPLLFLSWGVVNTISQGFPGPQKTEIEKGQEVWKALQKPDDPDPYTYIVKTFRLLPTLVYNCAHVPALCNNVKQKLGQLPAVPVTLHYDTQGQRGDARREHACPDSWIKNDRCPESDQPEWKSEEVPFFRPAIMWHNKAGERDENRLARMNNKRDRDGNIMEPKYIQLGAILSCDEWPAAQWIEGGEGATTYCAPLGKKCRADALRTEQNWQANGHAGVRYWIQKRSPMGRRSAKTHDLEYTIFTFRFKTVNAADDGDAVWVEAGGRKRYCHGPNKSGPADCRTEWDDDPAE